MEDTDEFAWAVKVVIKRQMRDLMEQLRERGEEVAVMTVNVEDNTCSHFGSPNGEWFISEQKNITKSFLDFCQTNGSGKKKGKQAAGTQKKKSIASLKDSSKQSASNEVPEVRVTVPKNLVGDMTEEEVANLVGRIVATHLAVQEKGDGSSSGTQFDVLVRTANHSKKDTSSVPSTPTRSARKRKPTAKYMEGMSTLKKSKRLEDDDAASELGTEDDTNVIGLLSELNNTVLRKVQVSINNERNINLEDYDIEASENTEWLAVNIIHELDAISAGQLAHKKSIKLTVLCGRELKISIVTIRGDGSGLHTSKHGHIGNDVNDLYTAKDGSIGQSGETNLCTAKYEHNRDSESDLYTAKDGEIVIETEHDGVTDSYTLVYDETIDFDSIDPTIGYYQTVDYEAKDSTYDDGDSDLEEDLNSLNDIMVGEQVKAEIVTVHEQIENEADNIQLQAEDGAEEKQTENSEREITTLKDKTKPKRKPCHAKTVRLPCNICGKVYVGRWNMDAHFRRVHCVEKNYNCSICRKGFFKRSYMDSHMLFVHTRKCPECQEYVMESEPWPVGTTMRSTRLVACKCGCQVTVNFTNSGRNKMGRVEKGVLKVLDKGTNQYACEHCGKRFKQKSTCVNHLKLIHKINDVD